MKTWVSLALWLVALSAGCAAPTGGERGGAAVSLRVEKTTRRPNIILIVADDLGYGDLGCYGQQNILTPNLDRLAENGIRFTQHYAGSTVCAPSRCALMTGLHTGHARIRGNAAVRPMGQKPLLEEDVTIAEILSESGYATGLFGKWGLGGPGSTGEPRRQGFDSFYGYLCQRHAHNYYPEFLYRNEERVELENVVDNQRLDGAGRARIQRQYSHDLIVGEALRFVDESRDQPFFLCLTLTIPHANNEAGGDGMEVPDLGQYANRDWPDPAKRQAAMISRMDRDIGRVVSKLEAIGIAEDTFLFFTSDNGPHREGGLDPSVHDSNGPLRGIKRSLHEGGIRVPLIGYAPGRIRPATTEHVSAAWDYLPTFCDLAGLEIPEQLDGVSFAATLKGQPIEQREHDYLYWEFHEGRRSKQAVRVGRWKAVRKGPTREIELYDLSIDPSESRDAAPEQPERVARIETIFQRARSESRVWPLKTSGR